MIKLNDNNIFIGQIKQLLKTFNLPTCPIGKENKLINHNFIDDSYIYLYKDDEITEIDVYEFGKKYENLTTNLKIENNLYDTYTHRYLGKYLRFLKAYKNIDLMSMYNCFDKTLNSNTITFTNSSDVTYTFSDQDKKTYCYSSPVINEKYTFAVQTPFSVVGCLTIDNFFLEDQIVTNKILNEIAKETFIKNSINKYCLINVKNLISNLKEEFVISTITYNLKEIVLGNLDNLRLLLTIPKTVEGSLVLLEGDYTRAFSNDLQAIKYKFKSKLYLSDFSIYPQLLNYTNTESYLLADKLIQYLTGNVICNLSEDYDIKKLQKYLIKQKLMSSEYLGVWTDNDKLAIQDYIMQNKLYKQFDMLGYCDADVEKKFSIEDESGIEDLDKEI